jgi:hypothetical protein
MNFPALAPNWRRLGKNILDPSWDRGRLARPFFNDSRIRDR